MTAPAVSVIVVSWNTRDLLRVCLASVRDHLGMPAETVVVDNASTDGSPEMVSAEFPAATLIRNDSNLGFGAANNIGMRAARGPTFLLLNSDARLVDGSIGRLVERLHQEPEVGIIGPRLSYEDGRMQASAHRFSSLRLLAFEELGLYKLVPRWKASELLLGGYWDHSRERRVDWVVGACMLVRREVFEETGGFDPAIFLYGEEVEWCQRITAAGWQILFSPDAEVIHVGHASSIGLVGEAGRVDLCLLAADKLIERRHGRIAALVACGLRVSGALLKVAAFNVRRLRVGDDRYGRDVLSYSRLILGHYLRRATGRLRTAG